MVKKESEFIKRVDDFARFMAPEYIIGSGQPRSLIIIAADCLDEEKGRYAMAHVMVGDNRESLYALRSMMEDNDTFSTMVHDLCKEDGADRSVENLDAEIGRNKKRMAGSMWAAVAIGVWTGIIIALQVAGITDLITTVSNVLLMAWYLFMVYRDIKILRSELEKLRQQRKRAVGRQMLMGQMDAMRQFFEKMRGRIEEDAADDDDDD